MSTRKESKQPRRPAKKTARKTSGNPHTSAQLKERFLDAYRTIGNITYAARAANVGRRTHYDWLNADPEYEAAVEDATAEAGDTLEAEAWRRAVEGVEEPVFHQGTVCGHVRKYDTTLLIFLLKAIRPEKFRDQHAMETRLAALEAALAELRTSAGKPRSERFDPCRQWLPGWPRSSNGSWNACGAQAGE